MAVTITFYNRQYTIPAIPDGWYIWSDEYAAAWLANTTGSQQPIIDVQDAKNYTDTISTNISSPSWVSPGAPTDQQVAQWKAEQDRLNAEAQGKASGALDALIKAAKDAAHAGGAGAAAALKFLADNGDMFAKIALAFGVGYAAATALVIGGGALVVVLLLKK